MRCFPGLRSAGRLTIVASVGLPLVACTNPFSDDMPTFSDIVGGGWLSPDDDATATPVAEAPLYCYGTIGTEDCHAEPLSDEAGRLVGYQGPKPPLRDDL